MTKIQISLLGILSMFVVLSASLEGMFFTRYRSENYKKPDLRQQRQLAQHLLRREHAQRDHHKLLRDENRRDWAHMLVGFVKRTSRPGEKQQVVESGKLEKAQKIVQREQKKEQRVVKRFTGTKVIFALTLASLCFASDGVCMAQKIATTNPATNGQIVTSQYIQGQEKNTWGPCEMAQDSQNKTLPLCWDIGQEAIITGCTHSNETFASVCTSCDPINEGYQAFNIFDIATDVPFFANLKKFVCERANHLKMTYRIASETRMLLQASDFQRTDMCFMNKALMSLHQTFNNFPITTQLIGSAILSPCFPPMIAIVGHDLFSLHSMFNELSMQFHVNMPKIFVFDEANCSNMPLPLATTLVVPSSTGYVTAIAIPFSTLKNFSDAEQYAIYSHEMQHVKQTSCPLGNDRKTGMNRKTGNDFELEADLAAALTNQDLCAVVLSPIGDPIRIFVYAAVNKCKQDIKARLRIYS